MAITNGQNVSNQTPLPVVRQTVRSLLLASPAYHDLPPQQKREMASLMVQVSDTAAQLVQEDIVSTAEVESLLAQQQAIESRPTDDDDSGRSPDRARPPLATGQAAGSEFSGASARRIAGTTRAVLNAVSFPAFVGDLINGVFKSMTNSNLAQMQNYIELLNNVASSTAGFADLNYGADRARRWLVEQFPSAYMLEGGEEEDDGWGNDSGWGDEETAEPQERRVIVRPGAKQPSDEALRTALGMSDRERLPSGSPDSTLVPLVRQRLARTRQETLATLVRLGMQRIVIDGGRINAAMHFHIDTRSAAQADEGSTFDFRSEVGGSGSFGVGPWGVSASMKNTIGYVSTSQKQSTEEMNVDLDLNSSVELIFRTDQVPLNRLANADQTNRILAKSRNPQEEARLYSKERSDRRETQGKIEGARRSSVSRITTPPTATQPAAKKPVAKKPATKKPTTTKPTTKAPANKTTPAKKPATKTPANKKPATKTMPAKKPATKTPGTKTPANKTKTTTKPGAKTPANKSQTAKTQANGGSSASFGNRSGTTQSPAASSSPPAFMPAEATAMTSDEQLIYEASGLHEDPTNGPINMPEAGDGQDQHDFDIPEGLMFSSWDVELLEITPGAGYSVSFAPEAGETGRQGMTIDWSHLPYGKIHYRLRAYASPDGAAAPATIALDDPNWLERAQDQVGQGVPINVAVRGQNAKLLYDALLQHQNESEALGMSQAGLRFRKSTTKIRQDQAEAFGLSRAFCVDGCAVEAAIIAGVVILVVVSIVVVIGMVTFALLLKEAMDKGYDITDTRYTVVTGEGETRQEHEMVFNLTRPDQ